MKKIIPSLISIILLLTGCSGTTSESSYPLDPETRRKERRGKLSGESGIVIFGDKKEAEEGGTTGIGINSYLWRAALDTISFMPLASADPFGGVIITDWYEDPEAEGERFKLNILITDRRLRSNAVKVTAFKQVKQTRASWKDAKVNEKVARELENKILTRARELKIEKEGRG